jgi:hypothetical protein
MRVFRIVLLLVLLPGAVLAASAGSSRYDELLAQVKSGNTAIDFQALRFARAELPGYNPYDALTDPAKRDLIGAMSANDIARVETVAKEIIERDYTDIDAHAALAEVYDRRGQREQGQFEREVADGLLRSIEQSGDGLTPETAYVVIGIAEEYSLLGPKNLQVVRQSLLQTDRGPVDALEVVNQQNGERQTVYFDVSRLFDAMARLGGPPAAK